MSGFLGSLLLYSTNMSAINVFAGYPPCSPEIKQAIIIGNQLQRIVPIVIAVLVFVTLIWIMRSKHDKKAKSNRIYLAVLFGFLLWVASSAAIFMNYGGFTFCS